MCNIIVLNKYQNKYGNQFYELKAAFVSDSLSEYTVVSFKLSVHM